jgi:hypothetical protein
MITDESAAGCEAIERLSPWGTPCPGSSAKENRAITPNRGEEGPGSEGGPVSSLAHDLSRELGCRVEVNYLPKTREVVAVAYPDSAPEVRVTLQAPIALQLINNAFPALKNDLLKELRRQMGRLRPMDDESPDIR